MSWVAVAGGAAAGIGSGLIGSFLGGDGGKSPLYKYQRSFAPALYGPGGIQDALHRERGSWDQFYNKLIGMQKGLGKSDIRNVHMSQREANASGDQGLINRGLFNTTVTDSMHRDNQDYANRNIQDIKQNLLSQRMGLMMGQKQKHQSFNDQFRNLQMTLFTGPSQGFGAGGYQGAPPPDMGGFSSLLTQLIGGGIGALGGGGGPANPTTTAASGWNTGGGMFGGNYGQNWNPQTF